MLAKKDNYTSAHDSFKKEFHKLRNWVNGTNNYSMDKIVGKLNIFEAEDDKNTKGGKMNRYTVRHITGSNGLTRLKENKSSYAIGDKDGNPITDFDFIYVPYHTDGVNNSYIEVITKSGDIKRFDVDSYELTECVGVGAVGVGAATVGGTGAVAAGAISSGTDASSTSNGMIDHSQSINYKEVGKEILTPTKERMCFLAGGYPFRKTFRRFKKHTKLI